ncbi:MAG: UDP-3-O-(3-hydroxymyristoyl)glucosamine N-acyltransferase [Deltaproteobacteria bacterium]|jgi:UDP-3-O-[3-hydroxymyristoyl] glucosamine N-acyltransferase|nr:UDP-3-O-(3-hydroxymyristoyl)glucosamine N-acyltransferase [Deltaproteobacteria bacterium]
MRFTVGEVAERISGKVRGDANKPVSGVAPFEEAAGTDITLAAEAKFIKRLGETDAGCIIVPDDCRSDASDLILTRNPRVAFAKAIALFHPRPEPSARVSEQSVVGKAVVFGDAVDVAPFVSIGDRVRMGSRVRIHPHVFIGDDVTIGDDVEIKPNVTVMERCTIGSRVLIQAGTVVGSDGFGFAPDGETYHKVPHVGTVVIEDDVEIGANNAIDRATFGRTWIRKGVKTDNLIQIAHNVEVGENTVIAALTGISGSVTIGRHAVLAGQAGISGHLTIGDYAVIGPKAGIAKPVAPGETVMGAPAVPIKMFLRQSSLLNRLPDMKKKLAELDKKMRALKLSKDGDEQ